MAEEQPNSPNSEAETVNPPLAYTDQNLNPQSPYYLHPNENPGAVLVAPPLDDHDYYSWSKAIRRALSSKKKIRFINGALPPPPETHQDYEAWETYNNTIVSWINRSLSPHIAQSTISIDNARELWLDLQDRFTKGNYFRMSNLLQELHSMKQANRTLTTYFTDMKILWDELEHLRPTPSCSCVVPCTCAMSSAVKKFKDTEYVICFLKGLSDSYATVRSQILTMDPLPPITKAYAIVSQQETLPPANNIESTTFTIAQSGSQGRGQPTQGRGRGRNGPKQAMLCTHCKKTNHTVENCYFKFGFPPGYRTKEQASAMTTSNDFTTSSPKTNATSSGSKSDLSSHISREDYNHLLSFLQSNKKDTPSTSHQNSQGHTGH